MNGDHIKMITNENFNVDLATISDIKTFFDSTKEMFFDQKALGNNIIRDKSFKRLLKSSAIMGSGISTLFLSENLDELCDGLKFLLEEKQAGNISDFFNVESIALADELLEYKRASTKQHKVLVVKCLNWMKIVKYIGED